MYPQVNAKIWIILQYQCHRFNDKTEMGFPTEIE